MATIDIKFEGICTHLVPSSWREPKFQIEDGKVHHRVFLANPALIGTHIDPVAHVPPHIPKLRIKVAHSTDDTERIPGIVSDGEWWEAVLSQTAISFEGVAMANSNKPPGYSLFDGVPHVMNMHPGNVQPRPRALKGWTDHAAAIIDLAGAVALVADPKTKYNVRTVRATLTLSGVPKIVFRSRNMGVGMSYALMSDTEIEITNLPKDAQRCASRDYLLNYFVTTLDLCEDPPEWPKPDEFDAAVPELYCGSTTYP